MRALTKKFGIEQSGTSVVEFALILPVFLLFLLGTIDIGRFIWLVNENEKAVQIGARWAVATDIVPGGKVGCDEVGAPVAGLSCYSYAINGLVNQGLQVPEDLFPPVTCSSASGAVECVCDGCPFEVEPDDAGTAAFNALVGRMQDIQPRLSADDVTLTYSWSGLGYSGDPNGPDVAPIVTVQMNSLAYRPLFLARLIQIGIPGAQYSLTMEDGDGDFAN